jgi:hypothetical protein
VLGSGTVADTFTSSDCVIRVPNPAVLAASAAAAVVGGLLAIASVRWQPAWGPLGLALCLGGSVLFYAALRYHTFARRLRGPLVADEDGVTLDGRRIVAASGLTFGLARPAPGPDGLAARAIVYGRGGHKALEILVRDAGQARDALSALGLGAGRSVAEHVFVWHFLGRTWAVVAFSWAQILIWVAAMAVVGTVASRLGIDADGSAMPVLQLGVLLALMLGVVGFVGWSRTLLATGADGVCVRRFGRDRFFPYSEVEAVRRWSPEPRHDRVSQPSEGFDLVPRNGRPIRVRTISLRLRHGDTATDFVADRIDREREAFAGASADQSPILERGARPAAEWVRHLRAVAMGGRDQYRTAAIPSSDLWAIAASPAAEPGQRAAAAIVLTSTTDEGAAKRLARVARAVANPPLRRALEAVIARDDARLEAAIARLEKA